MSSIKLKKDSKKRALGVREHTCRLCLNKGMFESYMVREMMKGTEEEFEYFVCDNCGCLQIASVPDNLGEYYGDGYFSFEMEEEPDKVYDKPVKSMQRVLDVGCGSGKWLVDLAEEGYGNCWGCDPFLDRDRHYGDRVKVLKCSIHDLTCDNSFDYIHMGDSFEHVTDPLETLMSAKRLLKQGGTLEMTLPVFPNIAFDKYGPHWFQIDAPRHIFLHSMESIKYLADKSGLHIDEIRHDSTIAEMLVSYFYQNGVHYGELSTELVYKHFTQEQLDELQVLVDKNNENGHGDHAVVFMVKD